MKCPECGSTKTIKVGKAWSGRTLVQRHQCKDCGRTFIEKKGEK